MAVWGWLVATAAIFVVCYSLLSRLSVRRERDDRTGARSSSDDSAASPFSAPVARAATGRGDDRESGRERDEGFDREESGGRDDETVQCPHCGTRNDADPTYTYCRHCVSTLRR